MAAFPLALFDEGIDVLKDGPCFRRPGGGFGDVIAVARADRHKVDRSDVYFPQER